MSGPDHAGQGPETNVMNITLQDVAHYNATHHPGAPPGSGLSLPEHGSHGGAPHHDGTSGPDHAGQGPETSAMNITLQDAAHYNATHSPTGAHGSHQAGLSLPEHAAQHADSAHHASHDSNVHQPADHHAHADVHGLGGDGHV